MDYTNAYNMFFSTLVDGDIDSTVKVAYEIFQRPIIVLDASYQVLSLYPKHLIGEAVFDSIYANKRITLQMVTDFQKNCYMGNVMSNDKPFYLNWGMVSNCPRIIGRFGSSNEIRGYFGIVYLENDFKESDLELAQIFANALSIHMKNHPIAQNITNQLLVPFLDELYNGNIQNPEDLDSWLRLLPISLKKNFCIIYATAKNDDDKAIFPYVCKLLTELSHYYLTLISGNNIIILLSKMEKDRDTLQSENTQVSKIYSILYKCGFQSGISFCFQDLLSAPQHLYQAQQALKVGREMDSKKDIYHFIEYAPYVVAQNLSVPTLKSAYLHPAIKRIYHYDQEYNTHYFNTLIIFLKNFKEKNKTAELLDIHRNTLNYRIQKIEEIGQINLDDQELSYYLLTNVYMVTASKEIKFY